ncbi:uncharacterized protein LOC123290409 isoform X2 [Chrysoperla carnea]|uniref:uncharacterized protein LOC123290409 isoform X2 n=1 Tax=Chrysoperla carnea TaxID=189513 RepID=UPI001D097569|nr:uncharacterized protein LOC123290409 isoform X2 [Chrysoperla carnea]
MSDFKTSDPFWTTANFLKHDSSHFGLDNTPMIVFMVIFVLFVISIIALACYFQRKQLEIQRELAAQGYSIGVVSVNGQQGFIATPPQRTVVQMQHPPPTASGVAPPPYNPNYSHPPVYTTMPHQTKY